MNQSEVHRAPWADDSLTATVKVLRVLESVARRGECGVADVLTFTGMPKSTVVRMLSTLVEEGFLERPGQNRYRPALKLWEMGCSAVRWDDVREVVYPSLKRLVSETNETAHYAVYDHGRAVYVEKVDGSHPVRAYTTVGGSSPAQATATGKALLAWRPEHEMRSLLADARPYTASSITSGSDFVAAAEQIRHQGYAANRGEWRSGVWGIAAPVFDRHVEVVGAVGVSGPAERIEDQLERYAFHVVEAARALSRRFGARASAGQQSVS